MRHGEFEDIEAWKAAKGLAADVYRLTNQGPFRRDFGLKDQIRRAAVSVMANPEPPTRNEVSTLAFNQRSKVYLSGHTGLVGSALLRRLESAGFTNLILRTHAELDLTDPKAVADFFADEKPEYVFLAAPLRTRCRKKHGQGGRHQGQ